MAVRPVAFDAVIFDMDGLMLDTEPLYKAAWQQATADCGYVLSDAFYPQLLGRTRVDGERILCDEFGPAFPVAAFRNACVRREREAVRAVLPRKKPGLDQLLDLLDAHAVPIAVATSTEREIASAQLEATGLLQRFDALATGDEVANGKPAPDLFLLAAERLGIDPALCLVLEDAEAGVIAAHSAGMKVFVVPDLQPLSAAAQRLVAGTFDSLAAVARHLERALQT